MLVIRAARRINKEVLPDHGLRSRLREDSRAAIALYGVALQSALRAARTAHAFRTVVDEAVLREQRVGTVEKQNADRVVLVHVVVIDDDLACLLYTSPSPRDS